MAKITTADCVSAIVDYFLNNSGDQELTNSKNWKRLSKSGSGLIRRIFENKKTGDIIHVFSSDTEIIEVSESGKLKDFKGFAEQKKEKKHSLLSCTKPTDIIIMGNYNDDDDHQIKITDDECSFCLTVQGGVIEEYVQADGFITVCTLKEFLKNLPKLEGDGNSLFDAQPISDFFLVKGYVGNVNLRLTVNSDDVDDDDNTYIDDDDNTYIDDNKVASYVKKNEWLLWDDDLGEVVIDLDQNCTPIKIDEEILEELKNQKKST